MKRKIIVALMIGELPYMNGELNTVTKDIVTKAIELAGSSWTLICESQLMSEYALSIGFPKTQLITALPQNNGHTTVKLARAVKEIITEHDIVEIVTHSIHLNRAKAVFNKVGIKVFGECTHTSFNADNPDWKLRSKTIFKVYNSLAWVYCFARRWV